MGSVTSDPGDGLVSFHIDSAAGTVEVTDENEAQTMTFRVDGGGTVEAARTEPFVFPVDRAVSVTTGRLRTEPHQMLYVRDGSGDHLGELTSSPRRFEGGTHFLEVEGSVLVYVRIPDASFTAAYGSEDLADAPVAVDFDEPATVQIGARSLHSRPAATVTVPDDPAALLEAVSYLGSSLEEDTCERSWPTLRGHPPAIAPGDSLAVPDALSKPDTGVTVEVPAEYASIYRVAPLAFYLGATLEAGQRPALHLANGHTEPLATGDRSLEGAVEDVLGRCLVLDSLVRSGGYYSLPRNEYDALAGELPFYPPKLADASIADQLLEYLEVEADVLAGHRPQWPLAPTLQPRVEDAELLAPLLDALAPIRVADGGAVTGRTSDGGRPGPVPATTAERPPREAARLLPGAFENQRERTLTNSDDATLGFVLGDAERASELRKYVRTVEMPALREDAVDVYAGASPSTIRESLATDPDFLYCDPGDDRTVETLLDAMPSGDWSPPVVAFGGPLSPGDQSRVVGAGAVAGLATDGPPRVPQLGRLSTYLLQGFGLDQSAFFAAVDGPRFFGNPAGVAVRLGQALYPSCTFVRSSSVDDHRVTRWSPALETGPLGSVTRLQTEDPDDNYYLTGREVDDGTGYATSDVVSMLTDADYQTVVLNGDPYCGERDATRDLVASSARRALEDRNS